MDITASERVYVVRRSSQTSLLRDLSHKTRARSFPGVFSSACSKTSTWMDERGQGRAGKGEEREVSDRARCERKVVKK